MTYKSNMHTHTQFCDGKCSMEEMIKNAIDKGFGALGFSPHAFTHFDTSYCMTDEKQFVGEFLRLKEKYGDKLVLHGGVNAVLWDNKEAIVEEIRRLIPKMKENGGYIFSSDHSVPNSVSLENMRAIVEEVKKAGKYD